MYIKPNTNRYQGFCKKELGTIVLFFFLIHLSWYKFEPVFGHFLQFFKRRESDQHTKLNSRKEGEGEAKQIKNKTKQNT